VTGILGYSKSEILNLNWRSITVEKQKLEKEIAEITKNPASWKKKLLQVLSKNGSLFWLETSVEIIKDEHQNCVGYRGVSRDVTEEIKMDISKNEFISMVSHELRTPLTSIIGAIGLLKAKTPLDAESQELLELADRNSDRLLKLINDILDIQKLSLGKILLNKKKYEFSKIIDEAVNIASTQAEKDKIQLKQEHILRGIWVSVDFDRTVQVILNLLSNAIKFSPKESQVIISNEQRGDFIRLNIKDFGPGIAYEIQGKLFEKFVQGNSGDAKIKGTGLGLNISKALIEQMGGLIGFSSQPSFGSTFYIDLPIVKGES
jgi:PAS domain S-box-containing protein